MKYFYENEQAHTITTTVTLRVQILKDKFSQSLGLPFKELLPESVIRQAITELKIKYKKRLFDPIITLWAFLSQILDSDKTVRKEIYVYLLAYNLLRSLMWSAGTTYNTPPLRLSLQGTRHHLLNFIPKLEAANFKKRFRLYRTLLKIIVHKTVPDRPARNEPRVIKRRPKAYPRLTKPRHELRKQLQSA
ncbi:hypothetical protein I8748_20905 [Nostoc sp. CENA67]|uniref:Uncharacterized protein n=1 Tax=Amazonocrinis nigriterrae CENA67 TaxID=2794033 RepID=A0A8J7HRB5_9NOST|nr:hypothetical protein [Amazonocrinis nigriterrae]MBH8564613.1 hypothetical protein [Amazonocrinis nigriterrae CENA67]